MRLNPFVKPKLKREKRYRYLVIDEGDLDMHGGLKVGEPISVIGLPVDTLVAEIDRASFFTANAVAVRIFHPSFEVQTQVGEFEPVAIVNNRFVLATQPE